MSNTTFDITIRKAGRLVRGYLVNKDWEEIDAYVALVESRYPCHTVECEEYEDYRGQYDDDENCGIVQD